MNFSDGQVADWYLDQMGRLGVVPKQQGYKPSAADVQAFQIALQQEVAEQKLSYGKLQKALQALEALRAGVLVVAADDRLSRDTNHAGWIATEVADLGAIVVDASKPEAEWIGMMFGRMQAQAYLESLRKNTVRALAVKKSRNERVGSIPYGFQLARGGVHLESHPFEYDILLYILMLRQKGLGGRRIAASLIEEGHRPRGAAWNPGNLQVMADRWLETELSPKMKADLERGEVKKRGVVPVTIMTFEVSNLP